MYSLYNNNIFHIITYKYNTRTKAPSKGFKTNLGIKIAVLGKNQAQVENDYLSKRFEGQLNKKIEGSLIELYLSYFHLL